MYLRIEGYSPAIKLTKHNLPEEALFFQPPSVKRSPGEGVVDTLTTGLVVFHFRFEWIFESYYS